ncbi:MAG: amino acid adenylation domain-containing protein, partial [bacterium]|nr:amino acid adenylation domain-containing protein [bacterium]
DVAFDIEFFGRGDPLWSPLNGDHSDVRNNPPGTHGGVPLHDLIRPFDLSKAPLVRSAVVEHVDGSFDWMVDVHHIVSDGISQSILIGHFMALYNEGREPEPLTIQYKEFAHWQNRWFESDALKEQEAYWSGMFPDSSHVPRLELPTDFTRPEVFTYAGAHYGFTLEREDAVKLRELGLKSGGTLFMSMTALLNILFYKITGQTDIIIGSGISGRSHADFHEVIGMFVNTLVIRGYPGEEKTWDSFSREINTQCIDGLENQDVQFEHLVEKLDLERDPSRNPLFDVSLVMLNFQPPGTENQTAAFGQSSLPTAGYHNPSSRFDMTFFVHELAQDIYINIEYYTGIFKEETIKRLVSHFKILVKQVIAGPASELKDIGIISEEEKQRILYEWNDTAREYPREKVIHQLFEEQAERTPDDPAVVQHDVSLSYRELNNKSNRLAGYLIEKGVRPESIVAIIMERSLDMIIGIYGILKAGAAYLPIAPDYPEERIDFMLRDSGTKILLRGEIPVPDAPAYPPLSISSSNPAYVIYTSGSTGKPKGVIIEHHSVINRLKWMQSAYPIGPRDVILQKTPMVFDVSVWELFWWSWEGAALCLLEPGAEKDPEAIVNAIEIHHITTMHFVPSMLNGFLEYIGDIIDINRLRSLKRVFASGEALGAGQVNRFNRLLNKHIDTRLINLYGPTEATVDVSYFNCPVNEDLKTVPIGKPIDNINLYVMDRNLGLQPVTIAGELCIAGAGLARGYLNRPELTAEKFVLSMSLLYKTGDLARWLPDGNIQFLGRMDHQVKIRGYRIELGEIENRLLTHEGIKEAVVRTWSGGESEGTADHYVCAYVVSINGIDITGLKEHLSKTLPDYMIPSFFIPLENIPLTPNGKVDAASLPAPGIDIGETHEVPDGPVEEALADIWADLLFIDRERIGRDTNFFHIGGHSLKAAVMISRVHQKMEVNVPLGEIFKHQTVKGLSNYIKQSRKTPYSPIFPAEQREYYPLSQAQERLYILQQLDLESTAYNMPDLIPLAEDIPKEVLEKTFIKLILRHDSLRTSIELLGHQAVQRIHGSVDFSLEFGADLSFEAFIRPFDLQKAPLLRVGLRQSPGSPPLLMLDTHHIISDGVSQRIMVSEFMGLYRGENLEPLKFRYKDYSQWQNSPVQQELTGRQGEYWFQRFRDDVPVLNLPTDYPRPEIQSFEGNVIRFLFDETETREIKASVRQLDVTLYMFILAIVNILLSKLSGQEDIIVGTPVAGRRHADLQHIVGMFVNTLAMRNRPSGDKSFKQFLGELKEETLDAYRNQDYPFEKLVDRLSLNRDTGRNPLFDVMVNLWNREDIESKEKTHRAMPPALPASPMPVDEATHNQQRSVTAKFDLNFTAIYDGTQLFFDVEYATRLFNAPTIEKFISCLKRLVKTLTEEENRARQIADIDILSIEDKRHILELSTGEKETLPAGSPVDRLFVEQVMRSPDHAALTGVDGASVSYYELNRRSIQL